ncbi:MAG: phage integrase N-terminal SAM-like domain-containing protein [Methanosarcinales archaeon]
MLERYDKENRTLGKKEGTRYNLLFPLRDLSIYTNKQFSEIEKEDIIDFFDYLIDEKEVTESSMNLFKISIKAFYKWFE